MLPCLGQSSESLTSCSGKEGACRHSQCSRTSPNLRNQFQRISCPTIHLQFILRSHEYAAVSGKYREEMACFSAPLRRTRLPCAKHLSRGYQDWEHPRNLLELALPDRLLFLFQTNLFTRRQPCWLLLLFRHFWSPNMLPCAGEVSQTWRRCEGQKPYQLGNGHI